MLHLLPFGKEDLSEESVLFYYLTVIMIHHFPYIGLPVKQNIQSRLQGTTLNSLLKLPCNLDFMHCEPIELWKLVNLFLGRTGIQSGEFVTLICLQVFFR